MIQDSAGGNPRTDKVPRIEASPSELVVMIVRLAQELRARLANRCADRGLNETRFAVLEAIASSPDEGCAQTQIAAQLGLSESNVCALVERMRTAGLLFRFRSKVDRRCSVLMLTERGRELVSMLQVERNDEAEKLLRVLTTARQRELHHLLLSLSRHLEEESIGRHLTDNQPVAEPASRRAS